MVGLIVLGVSEEKQCMVLSFPCPHCGGPWQKKSLRGGMIECTVCHWVFEPYRLMFSTLAEGEPITDFRERMS